MVSGDKMTEEKDPKKTPPPKTAPWGSEDSKIRQEITNVYKPKETVVDLKKRKP